MSDTLIAKQITALKARGNEAFGLCHWTEARDVYTQAMALASTIPELWSNRAACFMRLNQPHLAAADAYELVDIRPDWPKTYFRLGKASMAMGGFDDALQWYEAGLSCAEMLGIEKEVGSLRKCVRQAKKGKRKGSINSQLAKEMGFDSELFYVPSYVPKRNISVAQNKSFFSTLWLPQTVEVRDIFPSSLVNDGKAKQLLDGVENSKIQEEETVPGGGRGLFAKNTFAEYSSTFVDEQVICVSYSPFLCDFCGAALPSPKEAILADVKIGCTNDDGQDYPSRPCEVYCRYILDYSFSLCSQYVHFRIYYIWFC